MTFRPATQYVVSFISVCLSQLRASKAEMTQLREENTALNTENAAFRAELESLRGELEALTGVPHGRVGGSHPSTPNPSTPNPSTLVEDTPIRRGSLGMTPGTTQQWAGEGGESAEWKVDEEVTRWKPKDSRP